MIKKVEMGNRVRKQKNKKKNKKKIEYTHKHRKTPHPPTHTTQLPPPVAHELYFVP